MLPTFVSHLDTLWRAMDGQWLDYDGGGTIAKKSEGDDGLMLLAHRETQKNKNRKWSPQDLNQGQFGTFLIVWDFLEQHHRRPLLQ